MRYVLAGLGNPGQEYVDTRHNVGRMAVEHFAERHTAKEWKKDPVTRALRANVALDTHTAALVLPETYMNRSGGAVAALVKGPKDLERLVVIHDDIDLPFGTLRICFDRGAGGHRGVLSIARALKSQAFVRVRVGVAPVTPSGKMKKPSGEQAILDFILGTFTKKELQALPEVLGRVSDACEVLVREGRAIAMNQYNSSIRA